ncbi:type II secretory pathway, component PulF [Beggiatoa alba B18LD]|uniref:Type II secretory pathway, component PulF n=1 Tax=Beggiatoa alba B18LD TaxID=395493 RepID=I3CJL3_9GAMM|nr:type II secretion system F family protein [Beggiatoa alba]EIJ43806.1 type II secretory pathway, component PulF [Beggiatoa alba B18LD]
MAENVAKKTTAGGANLPKTEIYIWDGTDKQGKKLKGELTGSSEILVKALLRKQGITPTRVRKKPKPLFGDSSGKPITASDIAVFARQLTTMMSAGVPLIQAFDIVAQGQENPRMQKMLLDIKATVESGGTLADGLRQHPDQFDALFCNLVEAGEQAGALESLLDKVATYKEKTEGIKKKIKKALTYPIAVIVVAFIITAILMIFVVPVFADLFKGFGADLPALTQFVVDLSEKFVKYWYIIFGTIIGGVIAFKQAKKRIPAFDSFLQRMSLKMPIFGDLIGKSAVARFARTMATMFAAGTPLVEAMDSVAGATGNIVYQEAVLQIKDDVSTGIALATSMRNQGKIWPNMMVQMVQIGEESGALETMLGKVADFYEEEVDALVDAMSSLLEPMIMAFLGIVIGGLVVAMYLPIFKMGSVV